MVNSNKDKTKAIPSKKEDFLDLFKASGDSSKEEINKCLRIKTSPTSFEEKFNLIKKTKEKASETLSWEGLNFAHRDYFHVDGAIKLSEEELIQFEEFCSIRLNTKGNIEKNETAPKFVMDNLLQYFAHRQWSNLIFRNEKYYFLYPSLGVDSKWKSTSINDFAINSLDIKNFKNDFIQHYNIIDQHFVLVEKSINAQFFVGLKKKRLLFSRDMTALIRPNTLEFYREFTKNQCRDLSPDEGRDLTQYSEALIKIATELRSRVLHFQSKWNQESVYYLLSFMQKYHRAVEEINWELNVDLNAPFNKYVEVQVPEVYKKVLLGLLDAKINMLAFLQNTTQIFTNKYFLDTEYEGNLVLSRDMVRNIKKLCPWEFSAFKKLQEKYTKNYAHIHLLAKLEFYISIYMDIFIGGNDISYGKLMTSMNPDIGRLKDGPSNIIQEDIRDGIGLLESFFELMDTYVKNGERKQSSKGDSTTQKSRFAQTREIAYKKLIRLYREENNPLVMIKTAQNALSVIESKWFDPMLYRLNIMGVNYGWTLVGLTANYTIKKTLKGTRITTQGWNIIYSLYDVKNANSFLNLINYPYAHLIKKGKMEWDEKAEQSLSAQHTRENWLLIFDDNTNSGETLDNLRIRAKEVWLYWNIDVFACRTNNDLSKYKKTLTENKKLDFFINAAIPSRQTKINPEGKRYKEIIGTIVGNRLHKIMDAKDWTKDTPPLADIN